MSSSNNGRGEVVGCQGGVEMVGGGGVLHVLSNSPGNANLTNFKSCCNEKQLKSVSPDLKVIG